MIGVVLKKEADFDAFKKLLSDLGYQFKQFGSGRIFSVDSNVEEFKLKDHPSVVSCEQEKPIDLKPQYETRTLPEIYHNWDDAINEHSWGLARLCRRNNPFYTVKNGYASNPTSIDYAFSRTAQGVDCYLIDVGFNPQHPELAGRASWVINGSQTDVNEEETHGTAVASNMAGTNVGPAKDALIWYVQTPGSFDSDLILVDQYDQALQHYLSRAHTNRPAVLNHSFAGVHDIDKSSAAARAIIGDCIDAGIIVGCAAGNYTHNIDVGYLGPGEYDPDIVCVGAHTAVDAIYQYTRLGSSFPRQGTSTGDAVDIYAPGVAISCALDTGGYVQYTGTSMATPYTMGVIACMLEGYQRLTHREQVKSVVRKLIQNSTKGKLRYNPNAKGIVHNRILYLDPRVSFEHIPGLKRL